MVPPPSVLVAIITAFEPAISNGAAKPLFGAGATASVPVSTMEEPVNVAFEACSRSVALVPTCTGPVVAEPRACGCSAIKRPGLTSSSPEIALLALRCVRPGERDGPPLTTTLPVPTTDPSKKMSVLPRTPTDSVLAPSSTMPAKCTSVSNALVKVCEKFNAMRLLTTTVPLASRLKEVGRTRTPLLRRIAFPKMVSLSTVCSGPMKVRLSKVVLAGKS